jgi:putative phage-type endonuclease
MNYTLVTQEHGTPAWHGLRGTGIGASEIGAVLGVSPWASPLTVYLDKVDGHDDVEQTEAMAWGLKLERIICSELAERADVSLSGSPGLLRSIEHPWMLASPDDVTAGSEPVEVKNLAWGYREQEWQESVPEHYYLQCQQQMAVMGAARCLFGALTHGQRLVWEWIARDESAIQRIVHGGAAFWDRVLQRDPPASDGHPRDRGRLAAKAAEGSASVELYEDDVQQLTDEWLERRGRRLRLDREAKDAKRLEDAVANQIAQKLNGRSGYTVTGWQFAWVTTERKGYTVEPATVTSFKITQPKGVKSA